jgi:hypothetical protein
MASQINTTGKNIMLDAIGTSVCTHMALYTDAGGTTEVTGGTYARKAITWAAAAAGSKAINGTMPVFDVPAGTTVSAVGFCTALTVGTQHAVDDVTAETFTNAGTYTITSATIALT